MKREIKFRGQRIDNNEWVYGYYVKDPKGNHRIYWQPFEGASSNTYHFVKPETVSQFTGLTDKNGNEIYEGDIFISNLGYNIPLTINFGEYQDCHFEGCNKSTAIGFYSNEIYGDQTGFGKTINGNIDDFEFIGNIYENPELLNENS